jgi:hypothetical protein
MTGEKTDLLGGIRREVNKQILECYMQLHCILPSTVTVKSEHVMKVVSLFLSEIYPECGDDFYQTEVLMFES